MADLTHLNRAKSLIGRLPKIEDGQQWETAVEQTLALLAAQVAVIAGPADRLPPMTTNLFARSGAPLPPPDPAIVGLAVDQARHLTESETS